VIHSVIDEIIREGGKPNVENVRSRLWTEHPFFKFEGVVVDEAIAEALRNTPAATPQAVQANPPASGTD
jgi:hypothetical protein